MDISNHEALELNDFLKELSPNDGHVLRFEATAKECLNSNSMPNAIYMKSRMSNHIKSMAHELAVTNHKNPELSRRYLKSKLSYQELVKAKSKAAKDFNKKHKKQAPTQSHRDDLDSHFKRISDEMEIHSELIETLSENKDELFMYRKFFVNVVVYGPNARKFDPPNFYPTIKPFIDGLTDAGWWEDDNYSIQVMTSFCYGGIRRNDRNAYTFDVHVFPYGQTRRNGTTKTKTGS